MGEDSNCQTIIIFRKRIKNESKHDKYKNVNEYKTDDKNFSLFLD